MSIRRPSSVPYYRSRYAVPLLTALSGALVYVLTAHRGLTWRFFGSDGGDLITAAMTNGIPHPTGYPTYLLLSRLFASLPIGANIAHRFNLFSSVSLGIALFFIALLINRFNPNRLAGLYIGLAFAFTPLVWGQAIITEVYALNLAVLAIFLTLILAPSTAIHSAASIEQVTPNNRYRLLAAAVFFGIACTTHLTSALFGIFFILPLWERFQAKGKIRALIESVLIAAGGFFLGFLLPIAALTLRSPMSPVFWGDISTWGGFWWLISGEIYRPNIFQNTVPEVTARIREWGLLFIFGYSWIVWGIPLYFVIRTAWHKRPLPFGLIHLFLFLLTLFFGVYALFYDSNDAIIFFLPGLLSFAILCGLQVEMREWYYFLLPICLLWLNLVPFFESDVPIVRERATAVFSQLPPSSIGLTDGTDRTIFTLWYYQHVENMRPDVILVDNNLFAFDWYRKNIGQRNRFLEGTEVDDLSAFREKNRAIGPICDISIDPVSVKCE